MISLMNTTPAITRLRATFILLTLAGETALRFRKIDDPSQKTLALGSFKSAQILACLGSLNTLQSYPFYLPAVAASYIINLQSHTHTQTEDSDRIMHGMVHATSLYLNAASKIVNSFAIGLLFQNMQIGTKVATGTLLAISAMNIVHDAIFPIDDQRARV